REDVATHDGVRAEVNVATDRREVAVDRALDVRVAADDNGVADAVLLGDDQIAADAKATIAPVDADERRAMVAAEHAVAVAIARGAAGAVGIAIASGVGAPGAAGATTAASVGITSGISVTGCVCGASGIGVTRSVAVTSGVAVARPVSGAGRVSGT